MFNIPKALGIGQSSTDTQPTPTAPDTDALSLPEGTLPRWIYPVLAVRVYAEQARPPRLKRRGLRICAMVIQSHLEEHYPELESNIQGYSWVPTTHGPHARQFNDDLHALSATSAPHSKPLYLKKSRNFAGDTGRFYFETEHTDAVLKQWRDEAGVPLTELRDIILDVFNENQFGDSGFHVCMRQAALDVSPAYRNESTFG